MGRGRYYNVCPNCRERWLAILDQEGKSILCDECERELKSAVEASLLVHDLRGDVERLKNAHRLVLHNLCDERSRIADARAKLVDTLRVFADDDVGTSADREGPEASPATRAGEASSDQPPCGHLYSCLDIGIRYCNRRFGHKGDHGPADTGDL